MVYVVCMIILCMMYGRGRIIRYMERMKQNHPILQSDSNGVEYIYRCIWQGMKVIHSDPHLYDAYVGWMYEVDVYFYVISCFGLLKTPGCNQLILTCIINPLFLPILTIIKYRQRGLIISKEKCE